jgi:hypothetical protein
MPAARPRAAPALYLAVPLLLPLDLIPPGLTKAVLPKATSQQGRGFMRKLLGELEGAIDRAGDLIEAEAQAKAQTAAERQEEPGDGGSAGPKAGQTA